MFWSVIKPWISIRLEAIPKSNAAVKDSPVISPERGTSIEGTFLSVAIVTDVALNGMVFTGLKVAESLF